MGLATEFGVGEPLLLAPSAAAAFFPGLLISTKLTIPLVVVAICPLLTTIPLIAELAEDLNGGLDRPTAALVDAEGLLSS